MPEARKKAGYLEDHLSEMKTTYDRLLKFFGEDPNEESSRQSFFRKIAQFIQDYKSSQKKNIDLEADEERMEKRRQMLNPQRRKDPTAAGSPSTGAMDHLLEKLRKAGPQRDRNEQRRRRQRLRGANRNISGASIAPEGEAGAETLSPSASVQDLLDRAKAQSESGDAGAEGKTAPQRKPSITMMGQDGKEDELSTRAVEMLMGLRSGTDAGGSGASGTTPSSGKSDARERRRRRRAGSNANTAAGLSSVTEGSEPLPPSLTLESSEPLSSEDAAERAKRILLGMAGGAASRKNSFMSDAGSGVGDENSRKGSFAAGGAGVAGLVAEGKVEEEAVEDGGG